jgi:hypothetical protein
VPDWVSLRAEFPLLEARLHADRVIVDWRPGHVRLSPHWCVTEEELELGTDLVLQHVR